MSNFLNSTIRGLSYVKLIRNEDNAVLHLPPPGSISLDLGIEEQTQEGRSNIGEMVTVNSYSSGRRPMLNLVFNHHQSDLWEIVLGTRFAVKNDSVVVAREYIGAATIPAVTSGQLGFGISADQTTTIASIKGANGVSTPLTRVAYAGTPTGSEFSQGADMALKFGPDIIGKDLSIVYTVPINNCLSLSDVALGTYRIVCLGVTTENEVVVVRADRATPSLAGNTIDFSSPQVPVKFMLHAISGACYPYSIQWTGQKVQCA